MAEEYRAAAAAGVGANCEGFIGPQSGPMIEVHLSRPQYALGSSVVGTVLLRSPSSIQSARLMVVLQCRIDARWHTPSVYRKNHGIHPMPIVRKNSVDNDDDEWCPVWVTNAVDLIQLPERTSGSWAPPNQPLKLPPDNPELYFTEDMNSKPQRRKAGGGRTNGTTTSNNHQSTTASSTANTTTPLLPDLSLYTFQARIPMELPPTAPLTCCRYAYQIVVQVTTRNGTIMEETIPFTVFSHSLSTASLVRAAGNDDIPQPHYDIGQLTAMAHSNGLPCHVSADDIYSFFYHDQSTMIRRRPPTTFDNPSNSASFRVKDPKGRPCCIVTCFASCSNTNMLLLLPGEFLRLQFDALSNNCHQVTACLEGQETILRRSSGAAARIKTRTFLFDTAHATVDPGYTESVSLSLQLPLDAPISVSTNLVHFAVTCRIDISILVPHTKNNNNINNNNFTNLRLDFPITVVHENVASQEEEDDDLQDEQVTSLMMQELLELEEDGVAFSPANTDNNSNYAATATATKAITMESTRKIIKDLKILSLFLVKRFGLVLEKG